MYPVISNWSSGIQNERISLPSKDLNGVNNCQLYVVTVDFYDGLYVLLVKEQSRKKNGKHTILCPSMEKVKLGSQEINTKQKR